MKKIGLFFVILSIVILGSAGYYSSQTKAVDTASKDAILVEIPKGSSFTKASGILYENGLIKNKLVFKLFAKQNKMTNIKAGSYKLSRDMDNSQILRALNDGEVFVQMNRVLIPEGYKLLEIANRLEEQKVADKDEFLALAKDVKRFKDDYRFLEGNDVTSLEGYLFPDTYDFVVGESSEDVVRTMLNRFDQLFIDEYYEKAKKMDKSVNEIITMASVIEKEAKKGNERAIVAGVFYNRLKTGQKLESCATVQYLFDKVKPRLTYDDLEIKSPYNTYKNPGLPPAPIASPGIESIKASLYPEDVDYFYFFANEDGTHTFSRTYREHLSAQNRKK